MVKDFERDIPQRDEQSIRSTNFGGLNTTASPLNIPYEDSPLLLNVVADISGNVVKRQGTRMLYVENSTSTRNVTVIPFATGLQYNYLVCKRDTNIQIFEINNDAASLVLTKENVWDARARDVRASYVATSEVEPRLIMCTGTNKPVQLKFIEQQFIQTTTGTSASIPSASRFKNASSTNCVVFVNRVRVTGVSFSYNAGTQTLTVSGLGTTKTGDVIDLCLITWQWWAEGVLWKGDRMYGTSTRFNAVLTDQNVKVPDKLITDIEPELTKTSYVGMLDAFRRSRADGGSQYFFYSDRRPIDAQSWTYGDGSRYVYGTDNYVNPSPFFITFGGVQSPTDPTTTYIARRRGLKLNNGQGVLSQFVDVYVDGVQRSQILTTGSANDVYQNYRLNSNLSEFINSTTVSTTKAFYISFQGTFLGVPQSSVIEWANSERTHIGINAVGTRFDFNDGSYVIASGLGIVADYATGYYPRTINLYQGRIVLSGFAHRPLTVLFSAVGDSTSPGNFYSGFQITDDSALPTDAFDVVINSRPDDRIVSIIEWQSALFVLSRRSVFRLGGLNGQPISPTSRAVNFISAIGCVNEACVSQTETSVVYLSDNGLYDLTPQVENGEYLVRERSIKIRDKFSVTTDPRYESLPWVSYDAENRLLLVGYPAAGEFYTTRYLYVYNVFRDSWTEYNTPGGFCTTSASRYVDRFLGNGFLVACTTERVNGIPNNFVLLKFNDSRYLDFRQVVNNPSNSTQYYITPIANVKHTVLDNQRHFGITYTYTQQTTAFTPLPVVEVDDIKVTATEPGLAPRRLVQNVDYVKELSNIYLLNGLPDNTQLLIELATTENGVGDVGGVQKSIVVYQNKIQTQNYTVVNNGTSRYIQFNSTPSNSVVEWGNVYLTVYTSPLFNLQTLANYKRTHHVYAYFDNRQGVTMYDRFARNAAAGQDKQQIVDVYTQRINCNITMLYNSDLSGETSADIYGYDEVYWDDAVFDIAPSANQAQLYQLFKEPIQGVGWSYQLMVWNYDDATFKMAGYQIEAAPKGKRYTGRY